MSAERPGDYKHVPAGYTAGMDSSAVRKQADAILAEAGVEAAQFEGLASSLVWRIGRLSDEAPVTVRVGLARAIPRFADLPRLRSATDQEIEEAAAAGELQVEWVGPRP